MPLQIIRNDITRVAADAIVNTANPRPIVGTGTDSALHAAAGPKLLEARRQIGDIAPGHAAATPAFDLPARWVLHTVGPAWIDGAHGEPALLRSAYDATLTLAEQLGCHSVTFPLMGAGSYGVPRDLALSVALGAITDFLLEHDMTVFLVLFNGEAFDLAGALFADLKSYIDDNYVETHRRKEYDSMTQTWRRREAAPLPDSFASAGSTADYADSSCALPMPSTAENDLDALLRTSESTFSEFLLDLLRERSGRDSEVYKRAEISKQLFSKILSNRDYQPTKRTAIQLAIGLQLDLNWTQKLLEKAGYALTRSSKADLVVQYYIERGVYSVTFINEALYDCALPLLKTGQKP